MNARTQKLISDLRDAGKHLGNGIAGYRDQDFKRSAEGLVAAGRAMLDAADLLERQAAQHFKIEVCEGQSGIALYVNDRRVAGPRHNGVMKTVLSANV